MRSSKAAVPAWPEYSKRPGSVPFIDLHARREEHDADRGEYQRGNADLGEAGPLVEDAPHGVGEHRERQELDESYRPFGKVVVAEEDTG
jgi:hypothetical protein